MEFPYGEWTIFLLGFVTWAQRHPARGFYLSLSLAWLIGRIADLLIIGTIPWHLNYARLAVILVFWWWAWRKAEKCFSAFFLTLLSLALFDLFLVNEPGVLLYDKWIFAGLYFSIAWLATASYWGMAAAVAGSIMINQALVPFVFGGIVSYADLPDAFLWNFSVLTLTLFGFIRLGKHEIEVRGHDSKFEVRGLRFERRNYVKSENRGQRPEIRGSRREVKFMLNQKSD